MQEPSERLPTESFVCFGIQDEGVPRVVDDARWHRDEASARRETNLKPVSQTAQHQSGVDAAELAMCLFELGMNAGGEDICFDEQGALGVAAGLGDEQ
jgi:hypothetical protein